MKPPRPLVEVSALFLKLGTIGFGGPAATISMMENECVERRRWLPREQFLDILGMTNLIPGPNALEVAIHVGLLRSGWLGFLAAGFGFILVGPAVARLLPLKGNLPSRRLRSSSNRALCAVQKRS